MAAIRRRLSHLWNLPAEQRTLRGKLAAEIPKIVVGGLLLAAILAVIGVSRTGSGDGGSSSATSTAPETEFVPAPD